MIGRKGKKVKMAHKVLFTLFIVMSAVLLASCSSQQVSPTPKADMPNPASVYCEEHGGKVELRRDASGGVAGICVFADGSECDEWAYFRGECKPGSTPQASPTPEANMPNPASVYCEEHSGKVELRQDASGGVVGICIFADGSECDEWAYFHGECKPGSTPQTSQTSTPMSTEPSLQPSDPVGARDAVLAYLAENYVDGAPAAGLAWTEKHTKPEGLIGGESYEYAAGDWLIVVSYPVVAPENIVYTIQVNNQATGFDWEGQVDAQGQVTEISAGTELANDGWKIYRNRTLGYRFDYPADAKVEIADDPLKAVRFRDTSTVRVSQLVLGPSR
jgi:putative hemolysin